MANRSQRNWHHALIAVTSTLASLAIGAGVLSTSAMATDTLPWGRYKVSQAVGAHQPYNHGYSGMDILHWSPQSDWNSQYLRSRVPLQKRIAANSDTQKNPKLPADTEFFNLAGDYGNAFFESFHDNNVFSQYLFNYWQYTDYYGTWHGQPTQEQKPSQYDPDQDWTQKWFEFGTMNLPNPAYTNAAHKNGAKSIATIFLSDNDRGEQTYRDLLVDRAQDGTFPVATKLTEIAKYYGFDGYFVNQESTVDSDDVEAYRDFLKQLKDSGLYIQWYDSAVYPGGWVSYQNEFNSEVSPWVHDSEKGEISNSAFLNYWYDSDMLTSSANHAHSLGLDPKKTVFAGIEAGQKKFDSISQNARYMSANLDENGIPKVSLAALGADFVSHEAGDDRKVYPQYQNEIFDRERRLWTGSAKGDGSDIEDGWKGFASQISERSVISGPVFSTNFNTGHGLQWRDKGKVTSAEEWGNINLQDIPVTWQWWVDADSDPLLLDYDYGPDYVPASRFSYEKIGAYEGGSSLVISGKLSSDNTVRLFKSDLDVTPTSQIKLTYNKPSSDDSQLQAALIFTDKPGEIVTVNLGSGKESSGWKTVSARLGQFAGRKIATVGIRIVAGSSPVENYQVNLGQLLITDGNNYTPQVPEKLTISRLDTTTNELTANWELGEYASVKNYLLYLDDTFLGGRFDDNYYVKHLPARSGTLKLYAIGADGSRSRAAEVNLSVDSVPQDVAVDTTETGIARIRWTGDATRVRLMSDTGSWRYDKVPFDVTRDVRGVHEVAIANVPVDGSRFVVSVSNASGAATATGRFTDKTLEAYPLCSVKWDEDGSSVTLPRPINQDWRYLLVTEKWVDENGEEHSEPIASRYTYSQRKSPIVGILRGRSTPDSYVIYPSHGGDIYVQVEDQSGVKSEQMKVPSASELSRCSVVDTTLPNSARVEAEEWHAQADGKDAPQVTATIVDGFGNPLTGTEILISGAAELSPVSLEITTAQHRSARGVTAQHVTGLPTEFRVTTDSQGRVSVKFTSTTEGKFPVIFFAGDKELGTGTLTFDKPKLEPEPEPGGNSSEQNGQSEKPEHESAKTGHHAASDGPRVITQKQLGSTGASVLVMMLAAVLCLGVGALLVIAKVQRNKQ